MTKRILLAHFHPPSQTQRQHGFLLLDTSPPTTTPPPISRRKSVSTSVPCLSPLSLPPRRRLVRCVSPPLDRSRWMRFPGWRCSPHDIGHPLLQWHECFGMTWIRPLLAEKPEAFPILRPDAAEDIPLARFHFSLLTGCGRCVLDHWDRRISCSECPFYDSILLCPSTAPYCYSCMRALLPSAPQIFCPLDLPIAVVCSCACAWHWLFGRFSVPFPTTHHTYIHTTSRPPFTSLHKFFNLRLCPT